MMNSNYGLVARIVFRMQKKNVALTKNGSQEDLGSHSGFNHTFGFGVF